MKSKKPSSEFWENKTVLVTGGGGFIGSHLVEKLASLGAEIRAFIRYNSRNDVGLLSLLEKEMYRKIEVIPGDLRDLPALREAVRGADIVFHLGALISIPYSYIHPYEVVESNIMGTMNILLAGKDEGISRFVHTSTSEVYGTAITVPINEDHPLQGQSPYSASKIGADKIVESFYLSYGMPCVTVRPFNTYGPRQSARAVIPTIILQALSRNEILLGNLHARRDFTYISDTVDGFLLAGEKTNIEGSTINLGTGAEVTIQDLVIEIGSLIGKQVKVNVDTKRLRPEKSEVGRLLADNSLARKYISWAPIISIREGLQKTISWIKENIHLYESDKYQV